MPKKARTSLPDDARSSDSPALLVKRLEIKQFRCFEHLAIDLDRPSRLGGHWTCVVGINGSGKSSVLQALSLVLLGDRLSLELGPPRLRRMRRRVGSIAEFAQIRARLREDGATRSVHLAIGSDTPPHAAGRASSEEDKSYAVSGDGPWGAAHRHLLLVYGVTRTVSGYRESRYDNLSPQVRRVMTLFEPLAQIPAAEALLVDPSANLAAVKLFRHLLPQVFEREMGVTYKEHQLRFTVEGEPVEAIDLPDGFRSSVAWLADLCVGWSETNPDEAESGDPAKIEATVLIDEIDLHLHPSLQRTLVPNLRKALPRVQWVVTSHSPLVLSSFASEELVVLDRREPGGVRHLDRQILGFSMDQIYQWLMDTPASSAAMEEQLAEVTSARDKELAELLEMSPEVDKDEARERVRRRADLLKHLKS